MADIGHELTDELLEELEKRVKEEYEKALADAEKKLAAWLKKFTAEDEEKKKLLASGQITAKDYKDWRFRHIMMGKEWEKMRDTLAEDFHNANQIALGIARGEMADVYALNMNYGTYDIEHGGKIDTGFQLYNHDTAEMLMREENVQLMPGPSTRKAAQIAANKDLQWNYRHIQSAVLQGVLQGESPYEVAKRLQSVAQMNYNNAVRYARTMTTSAQNAGRYRSYRRARDLGVDLTIEWQATLDGRTRHEHRMMHGQRRKVDEPFNTPDGFSIMWPADCTSSSSDAPQGEIWNCRCTLLAWVKGFEHETVKSSPKMGDMSFEEWQKAKAPAEKKTPAKESYQYHATKRSSLVGITEKGLLPNRGHVGKGVYLADSAEDALEWTAETSTGGTTVLRVKESFLKAGEFEKWTAAETDYGIAESVFKGIIPLEEIEIKVNDNGDSSDWWSLAQYMSQSKRLYSELSAKARRKVDEIVAKEWEEYLRRKRRG